MCEWLVVVGGGVVVVVVMYAKSNTPTSLKALKYLTLIANFAGKLVIMAFL